MARTDTNTTEAPDAGNKPAEAPETPKNWAAEGLKKPHAEAHKQHGQRHR
jgi:hypothetical protein